MGLLRAEQRRCTPCRLAPPEFERAVAAAVYDAELREMLHLFKYAGVREIVRPLGQRLAVSIASLATEFASAARNEQSAASEPRPEEEILLIPVPLFRDRRRERGFNQAEALGAAALIELRSMLPHQRFRLAAAALDRTRATESQFALNPRQRRRNVRGAFAAADRAQLSGRDVVLIDDIFTTGSTARACATALRRAGTHRIWVATVARAEPEAVAFWDGGSPNA